MYEAARKSQYREILGAGKGLRAVGTTGHGRRIAETVFAGKRPTEQTEEMIGEGTRTPNKPHAAMTGPGDVLEGENTPNRVSIPRGTRLSIRIRDVE